MSSPWDALVIGGSILPDSTFGGGWELDTSQPLDGGVIGTQPGYSGDPFNFNYNTDGQLKLGGYLQCHQNYATSYHYPHVSDQRNKEPQHFVHPHHGNPNPLDLFEIDGGHLVMHARKALPSEQAWARIKGYLIDNNASEATYGYLAAHGGISDDWAPSNPGRPSSELAFFNNLPSEYIAPMVSTANRRSMSFGRAATRAMLPVGARSRGPTSDARNVDTWFPAIWELEDVPARCDLNGRLHSLDTYTPGNPGAGDVLNELDPLELFGYSNTDIHITSHHYEDGRPGSLVSRAGVDGSPVNYYRGERVQTNHTPPYASIPGLRGQWVESGVDRFPPSAGWPTGLICYWINGVVQALYPMPSYLGFPKAIYEPLDNLPYIPRLDSDYSPIRLGSQQYDDGSPAYTHWFSIWNIAMSAGFTRTQAASAINSGTAPSFSESESMRIDWAIMQPLLIDNPDTRPLIDYTAGDFGGSGDGVGEYIGGVSGETGGTPGTPGASFDTSFGPGSGSSLATEERELVYRVHVDPVTAPGIPVNCRVDITKALPEDKRAVFAWTHGFGSSGSFADASAQRTTLLVTGSTQLEDVDCVVSLVDA